MDPRQQFYYARELYYHNRFPEAVQVLEELWNSGQGWLENRLESGSSVNIYHLDCDSTTFYPYRTKEDVPEDERDTYVSRYDTYTITGLPAGPICNPGIDAIRAVLDPSTEMSGYYYFCHDKNGKAYYARTQAEHEENMREAGLLE